MRANNLSLPLLRKTDSLSSIVDPSPATRNRVLVLCSDAEIARSEAITRNTQKECSRAWSRWTTFFDSIEMKDDEFLESFAQATKTRILAIFAQLVRNREDHVAQTFRDCQHVDPRLDESGNFSRLLSRQYTGYKNNDPATKQQKAVPISILNVVERIKNTERLQAISELVTGVFFFAMRSCENLTVTTPASERKTKRLRLRNLRFFRNHRLPTHEDPTLEFTDCISIVFEDQKNHGDNHDIITQQRSGDFRMCPVRSWAKIAKRVLRILRGIRCNSCEFFC